MQFPGQGKPPVGIVFDSDMGSRIDSVLALALLHGFDGKNEARLVTLSVTTPSLQAAAFCDAVRNFYAGATNPAFRGFFRGLPVGLSGDGKAPAETPLLEEPLARRNADGTPAYQHGIHKLNDTAEVTALIRNALTAQQDQNAIVLLAGPATNLAKVLELPGAKEWVARKVRLLCVAGGAFPQGPPEARMRADVAAAKKLFAEWPTPVVAAGQEVGEALRYPASSIEKDFTWTPAHPVVDAYRAHQRMPYDAPAGALAAALHAVKPQEGYFRLSEAGMIAVLDDGQTRFTPSAAGKHRYLVVDPGQQERIIKVYTELASAKPVPRQPRFRPPEQQKKQAPPEKPPEAKPPTRPGSAAC